MLNNCKKFTYLSALPPNTNQDEESYFVDPNTSDEFFPSGNSKLSREEEEAILQDFREQKILNNDRWQSVIFRDSNCGDWEGIPIYSLVIG
jgi:hypothetical protein